MALCFGLHAIILVALLCQASGSGRIGRASKGASRGDLVEVSIAPPSPAKSPQSARPQIQTASRPLQKSETPTTSPGDSTKASPTIIGSGANADSGDGSSRAAGNAADFQQQLFSHIQRFQTYPLQARQDRLQGRVIIIFVMSRTGMVLDARVQTSSGYPILDQAAVDTITRAQPMPPIPAELADPLEVEIPIEFSLPR
jgi:protein TonB